MRAAGTHQTTYSDWARAVVTHYPHELTFKLDPNGDLVELFYGDNKIGYYDFGDGTGGMEDGPEAQDASAIGKWPNFMEIDVDKLIKA